MRASTPAGNAYRCRRVDADIGLRDRTGLFLALAVAPEFTAPVIVVVLVWLLATMTVAVRQALDFDSTLRAALVCAMG